MKRALPGKKPGSINNARDDPGKGPGLRVIRGITKKSEYQLTLGLNVFTMTL